MLSSLSDRTPAEHIGWRHLLRRSIHHLKGRAEEGFYPRITAEVWQRVRIFSLGNARHPQCCVRQCHFGLKRVFRRCAGSISTSIILVRSASCEDTEEHHQHRDRNTEHDSSIAMREEETEQRSSLPPHCTAQFHAIMQMLHFCRMSHNINAMNSFALATKLLVYPKKKMIWFNLKKQKYFSQEIDFHRHKTMETCFIISFLMFHKNMHMVLNNMMIVNKS